MEVIERTASIDLVDFYSIVLSKHVAATLASVEYRSNGIPDWALGEIVFGDLAKDRVAFEETTRHRALMQAISTLKSLGLLESGDYYARPALLGHSSITPRGRRALHDWPSVWREICSVETDVEHECALHILNRLGIQNFDDHAVLDCVDGQRVLADPAWTWGADSLWATVSELERLNLVLNRSTFGITSFCPTYRSLVWETRRKFTIDSSEIDAMVAEGETPTLDLKRQLELRTASQKAELIKDVVALANTKASGRRFLLIGFTDDGDYFDPCDPTEREKRDALLDRLTQERLQQIVTPYTTPAVQIRYSAVAYRLGPVGKLEVLRDPTEVPYAVRKGLGDRATGQHRVEIGEIFLRDGTVTRRARQEEIEVLCGDAQRAKRRRDQPT